MEQRDSGCPYYFCCEATAKGTGLGISAGKEDPVELDSSIYVLTLLKEARWRFVE